MKLEKVLRYIDAFTKWQGYIISFLCITLIGITMVDIVGRQLGFYTAWAFDLEWFQYSALLMLALGYGVLRQAHVRIDLVTSRFSPRVQSFLIAFSYLAFVIPFTILIAKYAWDFGMISKVTNETTLTAWHGALWPIKFLIFIGFCLMIPQCFAELIRHTIFVFKKEKL